MMRLGTKDPLLIHPLFWVALACVTLFLAPTDPLSLLLFGSAFFSALLFHHYVEEWVSRGHGRTIFTLIGPVRYFDRKPKSWRQTLFPWVLGVLSSLGLGALCWGLFAGKGGIAAKWMTYFAFANLSWGALNCIPVRPLDAGEAVTLLFHRYFGVRGTKAAHIFSMTVAALLVVTLLRSPHAFLLAVYFMLLFTENWSALQSIWHMGAHDHDEQLQKQLSEADRASFHGDRERAEELLLALRDKTGSGMLYVAATERLAMLGGREGDWQSIFSLLYPLREKISDPSYWTLLQAAYCLENYRAAEELGTQYYGKAPSAEAALFNAKASARLGKAKRAANWLYAAQKEWGVDLIQALRDPAFDTVRKSKELAKLAGGS